MAPPPHPLRMMEAMTDTGGRAAGPGGRRRAVRVLALAAALVGAVVWAVHAVLVGLGPPPPPDVAGAARSGAVQRTDRQATALANRQLAALTRSTPWVTYVGTSTVDYCHSELATPFVLHGSWLPVTCRRSATLYGAFDGDFRQRLGQLDAAARSAGWQQGQRGLLAQLVQRLRPPADAAPSATAGPLPGLIAGSYSRPPEDRPPADPAVVSALGLTVTRGPVAPDQVGWDGFWADKQGVDARPFSEDTSVYFVWKPIAVDALARTVFLTHHYMVAISMSSTYYVQQPSTPGLGGGRVGPV